MFILFCILNSSNVGYCQNSKADTQIFPYSDASLLTPNNLGKTRRRICSLDIRNVSTSGDVT